MEQNFFRSSVICVITSIILAGLMIYLVCRLADYINTNSPSQEEGALVVKKNLWP